MKFDSHYTPAHIAEELVNLSKVDTPLRVADFAAGYGSLLEAAKRKFSSAQILANDISEDALFYISTQYPSWNLTNIDFLDLNRVKRYLDEKFTSTHDKFDLILLNPPFSQRGGGLVNAFYNDQIIKCSPALAFVINSLNFLKSEGELVAILPSSCLTSDKDESARNLLQSYYNLSMELKLSKRTFDGCSVHTICVRISKLDFKGETYSFHQPSKKEHESNSEEGRSALKLFRGKLSIPRSEEFIDNSTGYQFIHTTSLSNGNIISSKKLITKSNSTISGPCVLIPRVCKPSLSKVVVYYSEEPIVISDCIIAVFPSSDLDVNTIKDTIHTYWPLLMQLYTGTCAQYLTLNRLRAFFQSVNIQASIINSLSIGSNHSEVRLLTDKENLQQKFVRQIMNIPCI